MEIESILIAILEENKKLVAGQSRLEEENKKLVAGQLRLEKLQRNMAKDINEIKEYQQKGLDVDIERLQNRVKKIEDVLKIV